MTESFRAFAEGLIDYAGMFPPAALSLEKALERYLHDRAGGDAWMLGRFLCPTGRLSDLARLLDQRPRGGHVLHVSAIGRGGTAEEFERGLRADLAAIEAFHGQTGSRALVDALETALPPGHVPGPPPEGPRMRFWYEVRHHEEARASLPSLGLGVASGRAGDAGIKLRCGGVTAEAFPSVEQVAFVIAACARVRARFKATAGLHHPVRSFRSEVGTKMHGFLNVFGAALIAYEHGPDEVEVARILEDEDPASFVFTDAGFRWKDREVPSARMRELRDLVSSFGSCSFDEPREDLRALGILG